MIHNLGHNNSNFLALTDANYSEWAIHMEADLIKKGLWEYVFGEVEEPSGDLMKMKRPCGISHKVQVDQGQVGLKGHGWSVAAHNGY